MSPLMLRASCYRFFCLPTVDRSVLRFYLLVGHVIHQIYYTWYKTLIAVYFGTLAIVPCHHEVYACQQWESFFYSTYSMQLRCDSAKKHTANGVLKLRLLLLLLLLSATQNYNYLAACNCNYNPLNLLA